MDEDVWVLVDVEDSFVAVEEETFASVVETVDVVADVVVVEDDV